MHNPEKDPLLYRATVKYNSFSNIYKKILLDIMALMEAKIDKLLGIIKIKIIIISQNVLPTF